MTDTRINRYFTRTVAHIHRVQCRALELATRHRDALNLTFDDACRLLEQVMLHDRSKFSREQSLGYVELTEYFHQRKALGNRAYDYPEGARERADRAVQAHYVAENHHPERLTHEGAPAQWTGLQALEAACDLQAMADEFGEGSARKFWTEVWLPKHRDRFYDDYNYWTVHGLMDRAFTCFEAQPATQEGAK